MKMGWGKYYSNKNVVKTYDSKRFGGVKGRIYRRLELSLVENLIKSISQNVKNIVEIGVGTGFVTQLLTKYGKVTGIDLNEEMLFIAKKKLKNVTLKKGDVLKLNIKNKYDLAVSVRVISHFSKGDVNLAFSNISKILYNGGFFIFNFENPSLMRIILRRFTKWGSTHTYQYPLQEIRSIVNSSGLQIDKILFIDHFFLFPLHIVNKLLFNFFDNLVFNLELKLSHIYFMSNNSFVRCKK